MTYFRLGVAASVLAVGLLLSGCAAKTDSMAVPNIVHVNLGVLNAIDCASAHIAKDRGYFAAQGLDVDIQTMPSGLSVLPALQKGALDIGYGNYVSYFAAESRGAALHIASDGYQLAHDVQPLLTLPDAPIHTPRDLAGKTIAVQLVPNIQTLLINELVRAYGVDPASVRYVAVPFAQMAQALKRGEVNAVSTIEPFTTQIESTLGARVVADLDSGATQDAPLGGYVSTQAWATRHHAAMMAFRRAMQRAAIDAADRSNVQAVLTKYDKIAPQTAALVNIGVYPTTVSRERLTRIVNLMTEAGALTKPIDLVAMTS